MMKIAVGLLIGLGTFGLQSGPAWAQRDGVVIQPVLPARLASRSVWDLSNLTMAKFDAPDEKPHLVFLIEQFREEERERTVPKFKTEVRTRTVTVVGADGQAQQVEQTYSVKVPFTEKRRSMVPVSAGIKPFAVELQKTRIYRMDASQVDAEEAAELLATLRPVFLVRSSQIEIEPANDLIQKAMLPSTLIVLTDALPSPPP